MTAVRGLTRLWLIAAVVVGWQLVTKAVGDSYFPTPLTIVKSLYHMWFSGPVSHVFLTDKAIDDFKPSLEHLFSGWLISAVAGVLLGVLIGRSEATRQVLEPVLQFARALPTPALVPFFVVVFDLGAQMQVATIVSGVIWPILLNTIDGVRSVDPLQLETAEVFGMSRPTRLLRIILPAASPKIFAGLRVGLSFALILMVLSELVGSTTGIGSRLIGAQRDFDNAALWAGIVLLGILGYLLNGAFLLAERRFLSWHTGAHRN